MSRSNNPFEGQENDNINIDKLAQQMALTLKKLTQPKEKVAAADLFSDNSHSSMPIQKKTLKVTVKDEIEGTKRQDPIKITPVPRKRHKTNSQYEGLQNDDSQFIDSISNRKITQFFNKKQKTLRIDYKSQKEQLKHNSSQEQDSPPNQIIEQQQEWLQQNHPVVKSLREKIIKKQKSIEQLSLQVQKMRDRYQKMQQDMESKKENQINTIVEMMGQKFSQKIYKYRLKKIRETTGCCEFEKKIYEEIVEKIELLKNQKSNKKSGKGKMIIDEAHSLDIYGEQRQSYLNSWKKKLDNEKAAVEKEMSRIPLCEQIQIIEQHYIELPPYLLTDNQVRKIFDRTYLPLYCRYDCENYLQIRALNLSKLAYQNMVVLYYPKVMRRQKRIQFKLHLKDIFTKSIVLNEQNSHSIFTNNTKFAQLEHNIQEYIIMGRAIYEQDQPTPNLKHLLKRYESLPENVAKYIVKTMIRAHDRIRKQLNHEAIILPQNFIFNQRNDVKIDNWVLNQIYRFPEFANSLYKDSKYLYLPPQYKISLYNDDTKNSAVGIWTVGVILYEMLFGKKPFSYSKEVDHEQFYMMNEVQFPSKPQLLENGKQFIKLCLCKPQNRITFEKALKHPFFQLKK